MCKWTPTIFVSGFCHSAYYQRLSILQCVSELLFLFIREPHSVVRTSHTPCICSPVDAWLACICLWLLGITLFCTFAYKSAYVSVSLFSRLWVYIRERNSWVMQSFCLSLSGGAAKLLSTVTIPFYGDHLSAALARLGNDRRA